MALVAQNCSRIWVISLDLGDFIHSKAVSATLLGNMLELRGCDWGYKTCGDLPPSPWGFLTFDLPWNTPSTIGNNVKEFPMRNWGDTEALLTEHPSV